MNYFELYSIEPSLQVDKEVVKKKYYELAKLHHPDKFTLEGTQKQEQALEYTAANNRAYKIFNDRFLTLQYVLQIHHQLEEETNAQLPSTFLMEMMEINETIEAISTNSSPTDVQAVSQQISEVELKLFELVKPLYATNYISNFTPENFNDLKDYYYKMKYLLRIKENFHKFASQ